MGLFEKIISTIWNTLIPERSQEGLRLGFQVRDGLITRSAIRLSQKARQQHIAVIGKTGTGKSGLLRYMMAQDIKASLGFVCIDLHGDLIPFLLDAIAKQELERRKDLSGRVLLVDPASPDHAVGLNLIESELKSFIPAQISEMVNMLRTRWQLEHFGARTEELLRNALWVLCEHDLTLIELAPLLTNSYWRSALLQKLRNTEVKRFFEERYDRASEAMQAVMREAVLNKVTAFTTDAAIRHIVGQQKSAFSLRAAMDQGAWILLDLRKASIGDNALTFAALFLAKLKHAIFSRRSRALFSIYADELPNLVAADDSFLTLLSEARKFGVSVVTANQFLNQFSPAMRSALFSVGTSLCFQLSAEDAPFMARVLGGESGLVRQLASLPHRHFAGRFGERLSEMYVPDISRTRTPFADLVSRSLSRFAKPREVIEEEINARQPAPKTQNDLADWE